LEHPEFNTLFFSQIVCPNCPNCLIMGVIKYENEPRRETYPYE